jgi:hypothetical protein
MTLRDYGLGESTQYVRGVARVVTFTPIACPNCHGVTVFPLEVDVEHPNLNSEGGRGVGTYLGCAACPWAGPMVMEVVR